MRQGLEVHLLPPTIYFDRDLAIEIAEDDAAVARGVAVFEIDLGAAMRDVIGPVKVYGEIPTDFRCADYDKVIGAAPAPN